MTDHKTVSVVDEPDHKINIQTQVVYAVSKQSSTLNRNHRNSVKFYIKNIIQEKKNSY
jgi:hypothetical protein